MIIKRESRTIAEEAKCGGTAACKEGKIIGEERKDQEMSSGKADIKFQKPKLSEAIHIGAALRSLMVNTKHHLRILR